MALQWKTIPYSDEVAAIDHTHVEADITDLSHDAVSLQGRAVTDTAPDDGDALVWNATAEQWEPAAVEGTGGATALDDLTDVTLGTPQTGHVLVYDTDHWEAAAPGAPASHTHVEADITDLSHDAISLQGNTIADTAPDDGDALVWNATAEQWEPAAIEGTGGATALDDLTDVTLGTPQTGDVLVYDTDHWEAAAPGAPASHTHVEADITDLSHDAVSLQGRTVADTAPDDGDALVWNATAEQWEPAAVEGTGGATALGDLTDVTLGTPQTGDVLVYDTDHWEAAAPAAAVAALDDLTDVTLGTPQTGDVLVYDTDHWEAAAPGAPAVHTHAGTDITSAVANATDADTLDGQHASAFAAASHNHAADYAPLDHTHEGYATTIHTHAGADITSAVANAGDADTLDGQHASAFAPAEHTHVLADIEGLAPNVAETGDLIIGFNDIESVDRAATATVISFSNYAPPYAPANLLDGDDGTWWNAGSYTAGAYVTLDLGAALPVNYIRVFGWNNDDHRANFEVEYSDDNATYTLAHRFSAITTAETAVFLPDTITARYWRIRSTGYTYGYHNWILFTWELREFTGSIRTYPLAVGANGQILVADDAETLGVKWAGHDHSAEFAPISHTHVEADIADLTHNAVALQGYAIADTEPQDGATLVWNAMTALWTPGEAAGTGGGGTLAGLLDVGIPATPDNGQVLTWQTGAGQWKAVSLPAPPSTARVREFDFQPEYAGAVIDPATLGNGLLEAYVEAGQNAYEWTVIAATEESAYLYLRWRLPPGFTSFAGPLKVTSRVSSVAKNCGVELLGLYDATGANAIAYATLKNANWTEDSANLVAGSFAAGDLVCVKLRLFGQDSSVTYLAGIRIQYNGD